MRKSAIFLLLAVLVTTATPAQAGNTPGLSSVTDAACDAQFYDASFKMQAPAKWRWLNLGGVNVKVPYSAEWKVMTNKLPVFEKEVYGASKSYSFGRAFSTSFDDCGAFRQYVMTVTPGTTYKPSFQPYEAWVEKVGNNTVTFYQATGDRDTPGASAIILKGGKVIRFMPTADGWTKEARAILASIN